MQEIKYKAVKYIRLSSADSNDGESSSIINQRNFIDDFVKRHPEIEIVSEKVDDGFSGILFDRPAFKEMMDDIENGHINCVITKDLSRLGREYIETGRYLRHIFPAYGVRFIAITDNIDTLNDRTDDLAVSIRTVMNDAYCRDISIKTRSALNTKRANGDYIGACPIYGYKKDENNRNRLVIDEYPASVVRDIFRMKIDGHSAKRIAELLNERGILSPFEYKKANGLPYPKGGYADKDGAKWAANTIIRVLNDETYTGTLIQGKSGTPNYKLKNIVQKSAEEWHRVENVHEAIVKKHIFDLAQKILRLDTRTTPNGDKVYLFSGILICGCCGGRMTRKTVTYKAAKYHYYYCPTGKKKGCPAPVMLKEQDLMDCILGSVKGHIANVASLETLIAGLDTTRIAQELAGNLRKQIADNERRIKQIHEFKAGLYENMINGVLSKDEYKSLKGKYVLDADDLNAANAKLQDEVETVLSCKHERLAWIEHFKQFENLDAIDRRTVIHLIQSIRVLSKTKIEITFNYQPEYENAVNLFRKEVA